jgi:hypothetical protein
MQINTVSWSDFTDIVNSKGLLIQYYNNGVSYNIWAVDQQITYNYIIWQSGSEPIGADVDQIATDRSDFESNYMPAANLPVFQNQQAVVQNVAPSYGRTAWVFSHLFTDKTTWWGNSIQVTNETLGTGDGTTTTFEFANQYLIDLCHGKVTGEDDVVPTNAQGGTDFFTHITVGGTAMTETPFGGSAADYTINYATGTVTFTVAPLNGAAVVATQYFYSPSTSGSSTMYIRPPVGSKIVITTAECQFSADVVLMDQMNAAVWTYNPELGAPPAKFMYPSSKASFKRMWDFINWTQGAWPAIPPFGGVRGYTQTSYQLTFPYIPAMVLDDAEGAEMRVWLSNDTPYLGECGQITFYAYSPNN